MVAEVARAVQAVTQSEVSRVAADFAELKQRLARIEAQPVSGQGHLPVLRSAEKSTPLTSGPSAGPVASDQYRALESLAGRIRDPQAQVAVAAEMIRLQQEAAGMAPAMQVMPRAGQGWAR